MLGEHTVQSVLRVLILSLGAFFFVLLIVDRILHNLVHPVSLLLFLLGDVLVVGFGLAAPLLFDWLVAMVLQLLCRILVLLA